MTYKPMKLKFVRDMQREETQSDILCLIKGLKDIQELINNQQVSEEEVLNTEATVRNISPYIDYHLDCINKEITGECLWKAPVKKKYY